MSTSMEINTADQKDYEKLNATLERLEKSLINQNSFRFVFIRGIIYGLGFVIGTSVLAGIAFALLVQLFPFAGDFIKQVAL